MWLSLKNQDSTKSPTLQDEMYKVKSAKIKIQSKKNPKTENYLSLKNFIRIMSTVSLLIAASFYIYENYNDFRDILSDLCEASDIISPIKTENDDSSINRKSTCEGNKTSGLNSSPSPKIRK